MGSERTGCCSLRLLRAINASVTEAHKVSASVSLHHPPFLQTDFAAQVQSQPCVLLFGAVCLGVICDRTLDVPVWSYVFAGLVVCLVWYWSFRKRKFVLSSFALLLAWASLAGVWHHYHWNWYPASDIQTVTQAHPVLVCAQVKLVGEPRRIATKKVDVLNPIPAKAQIRIKAEVKRIRDGQNWKEVTGQIELVIYQSDTALSCGDCVTVLGRMNSSDSTRNPGQFDFRRFQRSQRQLTRIHVYQAEAVVKLDDAASWSVAWLRSGFRRRLDCQIWDQLSEQHAGFASAILLGNREQLSSQRRELFLLTGTVHLLAISGLHLGVLAGVFFVLFRFGLIGRCTALLCTMVFVAFFAWLVEFRPPILRASILILLFCAARLRGRDGFSFNLLALAGLMVLAINPSDLFQIGPQLSFLAVATIIFSRPWTEVKVEQDPLKRLINNTRSLPVRTMKWLGQKSLLACKISALIWVVSMPLVAFHFHLVAPVALVLNPLLMVPVTVALYSGLGVLVFAWWPWAANCCAWICDQSLGGIEWMVILGQKIPCGHFWTSGPQRYSIGLFYLLILFLVVYPPIRLPGRWICTIGLVWVVFAWIGPTVYQDQREWQRDDVEVLIVDTGHGGGVVLRLPHGKTMVYDAGNLTSAEYGVANISSVLWSRQVQHIDALVISHADIDHFNSAVELSQRFSIGVVYISPAMQASDSTGVDYLLRQFHERGIEVRILFDGNQFLTGSKDVKILVLGPPFHGTLGNDNSDSLVLSIEAYGKRMLLPGDLEGPGLARLLSLPAQKFDVVMAPHHGSLNSDPAAFSRWAKPEHVVISANGQRVCEQALAEFRNQGCKVWVTGYDGAIHCRLNEGAVSVQKWIRKQPTSAEYYDDRGFLDSFEEKD